MKKDLTEIVMIIDESGSMSTLRNDVIGGINTFLKDQKELPGEANLTLIKFNTSSHVVIDGRDIQEVRELSDGDYYPGGGTALLDAVGQAIDTVGKRLADTKEKNRPEKVVIVVTTDGEENSSQEYTKEMVSKKIKEQTDEYNWEFIFTGANIDSFAVGGSLGYSAFNTVNYKNTSEGINTMYSAVSMSVGATRGGLEKKSMTDYLKDEESK